MTCTYARAVSTGVITWTLVGHGLSVGDVFALTSASPDGDGDRATLGLYTVATVPTANTWTATDIGGAVTAVPGGTSCEVEVERFFTGTYTLTGGTIAITTAMPNPAVAGRRFRVNFLTGTAVDGFYDILSVANDTTFYAKSPATNAATGGNCNVTFLPQAAVNMVFTSEGDSATMDVRYTAAVLPLLFDSDTEESALQSFVRTARLPLDFQADTNADVELQVRTTVAFMDLRFATETDARMGVTTLTSFALSFTATTPDTVLGTIGPASPVPMPLVPEGPVECNLSMSFGVHVVRGSITVRDIIDDAIKLWGRPSAESATKSDQDRLIADLNASLEEIFSRAAFLDYFNRDTLDVEFASGVDHVALPATVQNLHGYVKAPSGKIVTPITEREAFDSFESIYLTADDSRIEPHAYYLDRKISGAATGFAANLWVTPTPSAPVVLKVEATMNAKMFDWSDYINNASVPIPHKHAASILYPLMRKRTSSARMFIAAEQQSQIDSQYNQARAMLGYNDPAPASTRRTKTLEDAVPA